MRVLAPTAFVSRRPHHKHSPAPQQRSNTTLPDPPAQPGSNASGSTSSGPSPTRRVRRRTTRQTVQNATAILPPSAPGTSRQAPRPSYATQGDLYENDSTPNSPLFSPRSAIPSPRPTNSNLDTGSGEPYPPLLDTQPTPQPVYHPPPTISTTTTTTTPPSLLPSSNPHAALPASTLDAITQTTPRLVSLTQSLSNLDFQVQSSRPDADAYDSVMKCMEAAAMLERQLARIATGLRA